MDAEIKKKLQEMARAHVLNTYNIDMDRSVIDEVMWKDEAQDFLDGAQAAWDLAVKRITTLEHALECAREGLEFFRLHEHWQDRYSVREQANSALQKIDAILNQVQENK